jgi:hypothetical protein
MPGVRQKVDVVAVQLCVAKADEHSMVLPHPVSHDNSFNIAVRERDEPAGTQVEPACHVYDVPHKSLELHYVMRPLVSVTKHLAS